MGVGVMFRLDCIRIRNLRLTITNLLELLLSYFAPSPTFFINYISHWQLMATERHEPLPGASEETPLIDGIPQESGAGCSYLSLRSRFSPITLIIPIAILCRFTIMLPSTTNFRILQIAACRFWYYLNDPEAIPSNGRIPDELCSTAGVNRYYATMASILAVGDGVGSLFCLS